jgi:hypothetical protein
VLSTVDMKSPVTATSFAHVPEPGLAPNF